jgi:hypothetical protein
LLSSEVALTTLHNFTGSPDGSFPENALIRAADGNFYATTAYGGSSHCIFGCGTIFRITSSGTLTLLFNFDGTGSTGTGSEP